METVQVRYIIEGTVVEDELSGDHFKIQTWRTGQTQIFVYRAGALAETFVYRRAERIHRVCNV